MVSRLGDLTNVVCVRSMTAWIPTTEYVTLFVKRTAQSVGIHLKAGRFLFSQGMQSMSWHATSSIKRLRENLTRSEKFLLLILADYHNDETGRCDPAVKTLAIDALMSERHAMRTLKELARKGFVHIIRRRDDDVQGTNQYNLLCLGDAMSPPQPDNQPDIQSDNQPDTHVTQTVSKNRNNRTVRRNRNKPDSSFLEERYKRVKAG